MEDILAADIGGTFVDVVLYNRREGSVEFHKGFTTPQNLIAGVESTIKKTSPSLASLQTFVHGTTLGLNTCLQLNGARTAILTNSNFEDVFEMGRYARDRAHMYSLVYDTPPLLVPKVLRRGVSGRLNSTGNVLTPLDQQGVLETVGQLVSEFEIEALAICFLHAYKNPEHEQLAQKIVREKFPQLAVSVSSDIIREYREYERTSTTVLNAYIQPIFENYIDSLQNSLERQKFTGDFYVTRSGGGAMGALEAKKTPVQTIYSGPAGGLIGAERIGRLLGVDKLLTFDMGGTSTDCCVINEGRTALKYESSIARIPFLIPTFDLSTIGAGGGSIASVEDGILRVGPRSAGAEPGPICYGRGGVEPTITDSLLVLGLIESAAFLGGQFRLDVESARRELGEKIGAPLNLDATAAARGIVEVLVARTVSAIREITVEQGLDPREFSLLVFGGAGPLMGPLVARELGVRNVIVPGMPSVFSAWGMLLTDIIEEQTQTIAELLDEKSWAGIRQRCAPDREKSASSEPGNRSQAARREFSLAMRYFGQEHNLYIPFTLSDDYENLRPRFDALHEQRYGHAMGDPVEIVHLRIQSITEANPPDIRPLSGIRTRELVPGATRGAYCFDTRRFVTYDVYLRTDLVPGDQISGPAIVQEETTSSIVLSHQYAQVNAYGHIVISGNEDQLA
ncbi:MAG: hydantoinase/oxoprolinase family protein [Methyloligellaceae bacterium]